MELFTTRFGPVCVEEEDVITFSNGLIGMEPCRRWALLADSQNASLGWLQSVDRDDLALAVVSPRRFVPDYRIRIARRDLDPLALVSPRGAQVLVILSQIGDTLALNLKAPLVMNIDTRQGRQIVAKDDHSVQYMLNTTLPLRKIA